MSAETLALRAGVFSGECGLLHSLRDKCDPRHKDVVLLDYEEIQERRYAGWTMGQVNMSRVNPSILLRYSPLPVLDPHTMSGKMLMALLDELMATASIVGRI